MHHRTAVAATALVRLAAAGLYPGITTANHTCALAEPVLSCSPGALPDRAADSCCTETFGGLVVATQLWNTHTGLESKGQVYAKNAWSIHGLWPDFCNGTYTQYCDLSRQYDPQPVPNTTDGTPSGVPVPPYAGEPIDRWFGPYGKLDLLAYMRRHWVSQHDANWVFWAHEFSKHATCFSTFQRGCYGPRAPPHADLFDFFDAAVAWHRPLHTHRWLARAGIRPSNATARSLADLQRALAAPASARLGAHEATLDGTLSNCATAAGAVWYHERARGSEQ
ncbi:ribonuclease t2 family protein [Hirsutella rhossiliensis]|uniref:ribonuclease T2 n=1 Tax=Hirsutella rhossiliensis TaxID=111463 RepID=A0A9P8SK81_9HYPO|nr:ribonuclease t2 family domain-containing protein [Hirsutella rhossiliensis]KAH0965656.1 ribonuclease t2 family domain-containing protein [Hirsutella rhossiliensis]